MATNPPASYELHEVPHTSPPCHETVPRNENNSFSSAHPDKVSLLEREDPSLPADSPFCVDRWTPFPLRRSVIQFLCGLNVCLAASLVVLWSLSDYRRGLVPINLDQSQPLIFWHLVPTAIATADALSLGAIVTASLFCQPYILLQRESGVSAGECLTLDYSGSLPVVVVKAIRNRHWAAFLVAIAGLLSTTFSSLSASLFSPRNVWTEERATIGYTTILGHPGNVNSTLSYIQAIDLAAAKQIYGEGVDLPPLTNQSWTLGPIDSLMSDRSNSFSASNVTIPGWYGIRSDPACDFGQLVNTSVNGLNLTLTFADSDGECPFTPAPEPSYYPFGFVTAVIPCGNGGSANQSLAEGGSLVFARLTPARLSQNDTTAAVVIYCRPTAVAMSVDAVLDFQTHTLLEVENVHPLSSDQQQVYDPNGFANSSLGSNAWNGFVIDPAINTNVPPELTDWLNQWINLTISVTVGGGWLYQSTTQINGVVTDTPQAYSPEMRTYYITSLTNFYQTYLTLIAGGSYFLGSPSQEKMVYVSGAQTRLFVSTPACWSLIVVLLLSTTCTLLANLLQPRVALQVGTSPHMLITAVKLGRSPDFANLGDLRGLDADELRRGLDRLGIKLDEGELRVFTWSLRPLTEEYMSVPGSA